MMNAAVRRWKRDQTLADLRAARICSILTSTTKKSHPPKEFMIDYDASGEKPHRQTSQEMAIILRSMTAQMGGTVHG